MLWLISEWMQHGTILEYLTTHPHHDKLTVVRRYFYLMTLYLIISQLTEIAAGMAYLHSFEPQVIHRDLKGVSRGGRQQRSRKLTTLFKNNILVDAHGHCRLADFGISSVVESQNYASTFQNRGTTRWSAPERLIPERFGEIADTPTAIDIYSFACTALEVSRQTYDQIGFTTFRRSTLANLRFAN
jgi:abelson tyrosine-protein kinase 1